MAAINPITVPPEKSTSGGFTFLDVVKILAIVAIVGVCGWLLWAHTEWFRDPQSIKREVVQWGIWGPIIYMLLYAVGPSFLVPGAVMTIAAGLAFGTGWGSVYSLIGADVGAVVAFGAGRWLGKSFVERIVGERFHEVLRKIARNGFQIIFDLRMVPVIPYNALNLLAGASPIKFKDYFWASMIGMIPGTILFAFLGDALWHPMSPRFFLAVLLIALSVLCGEIWRRWSKIGVEEIPAA
jgi:uncharacterized membrane protein YdjX (TVP38/TMEM64 family)